MSWAISFLTRLGRQGIFLEKREKTLFCSSRHQQAVSTALLPAQSPTAGPGFVRSHSPFCSDRSFCGCRRLHGSQSSSGTLSPKLHRDWCYC